MPTHREQYLASSSRQCFLVIGVAILCSLGFTLVLWHALRDEHDDAHHGFEQFQDAGLLSHTAKARIKRPSPPSRPTTPVSAAAAAADPTHPPSPTRSASDQSRRSGADRSSSGSSSTSSRPASATSQPPPTRVGSGTKTERRQEAVPQHLDGERASPSLPVDGVRGLISTLQPDTRSACNRELGLQSLYEWNQTRQWYCGGGDGSGADPSLSCASTVLPYLRPATRPHAFCEARSLLLDLSRASERIACLQYRPGYKCEAADFRRWTPGSLQLACAATAHFSLDRFSVDHHRDQLAGLQCGVREARADRADRVVDAPVLLVTRENGEYANLFHAMSDVVSAVATLYMTGLDVAEARVLLLDDHPAGPYDDVWSVFGSRPPLRLAELGTQRVLLRHAVWVPPGYANLLLAVEDVRSDCDAELDLLRAFRTVVLRGLAVRAALPPGVECANESSGRLDTATAAGGCGRWTLRPGQPLVTVIARRPYRKFVEHSFMGRMISNEAALLQALTAAVPEARVVMVDLAQLSFREQLALVARTDLLVGMHGAGLAHGLFLPPHAGVLELLPRHDVGFWNCHQLIAGWRSLLRRRWANTDLRKFSQDSSGDRTEVDAAAVAGVVRDMLAETLARRSTHREYLDT